MNEEICKVENEFTILEDQTCATKGGRMPSSKTKFELAAFRSSLYSIKGHGEPEHAAEPASHQSCMQCASVAGIEILSRLFKRQLTDRKTWNSLVLAGAPIWYGGGG